MNVEKNVLIAEIKKLSNILDEQYRAEFQFRNHCYLRIAYDCVVNKKWDLVVKKPFIKYADSQTVQNVIHLLRTYAIDKKQLLTDNEKSLHFRKEDRELNPSRTNTLF